MKKDAEDVSKETARKLSKFNKKGSKMNTKSAVQLIGFNTISFQGPKMPNYYMKSLEYYLSLKTPNEFAKRFKEHFM